MADNFQTIQQPSDTWQGTDLTRSDFLRDPSALSYSENLIVTDSGGSLATRPGTRLIAPSTGANSLLGLGVFDYSYRKSDGTVVREILTAGRGLGRLKEGQFEVTYSGPATTLTYSIRKDPGSANMQMLLEEDGVVTQTLNLGTGTTAAPFDIQALRVAIDSLPNWICATGAPLPPLNSAAAFLKPVSSAPIGAGKPITYYYIEEIARGNPSAPYPFDSGFPDTGWTKRSSPGFDGVSSCQVDGCIYFQDGYDSECKYDGNRVYTSGVMDMNDVFMGISLVAPVASGVTATNIKYLARMVQHDARGNVRVGVAKIINTPVSPSGQDVLIGYTGPSSGYGFLSANAVVNGDQFNANTITVFPGHGFQVGDTAYLNTIAGGTVSARAREVTAVTATTITISGSPVDVLNTAIISLNLRLELFRQTSATSDFFFVNEFPLDCTNTPAFVRDTGLPLGEAYVPPLPGTEPGLPPVGKYIATYRGMKFIAEVTEDTNNALPLPSGRVFFSDIENPEGYALSIFAPNINACSFSVQNGDPSPVSGLFGSEEYLTIFKQDSISVLSGAVSQEGYFKFQVDPYSNVIGSVSQHTIQQAPTGEILFLHRTGVYAMDGRGGLTELSIDVSPIIPELVTPTPPTGTPAVVPFKLFKSFLDPDKGLYVVSGHETDLASIGSSIRPMALCLDLKKQKKNGLPTIYIWTGFSIRDGAVIQKGTGKLFFGHAMLNDFGFNQSFLGMGHDSVYPLCVSDHNRAIRTRGILGWIDGGEPSYFKTPTKTKLFAIDPEVPSSGAVPLSVEIDFRRATASSFSLDLTGSAVLPSTYADRFSSQAITNSEKEQALNRFKCKSLRYSFSKETIYENILITMLETELAVPYDPKMKE